MNIKQKFESIDQSQLSENQKEILGKIKTATKDFTITDQKALEKVDGALDNIITKLKATNPQAIKGEAKKREPKAKKEVVKKEPKSETKKPKEAKKEAGGKRTIFSIAKEIRKADESWDEAKKRAKKVMETEKEDTTKKMKSETDKLLSFIKRRKELEGLSGTSVKKDSKIEALPKGRRISKKGWKNQHGESEGGKVYYENRDNRTDRLAPSFADKIYLADGGSLESKMKTKLSQNFSLPLQVAVYVPSTKDADKTVTKKEFDNRVEEVEKFTSSLFGGFSANDVDGGYMSDTKGLIKEEVYKVTSFAPKENFNEKMSQLIAKVKEWAKDWGQESIGLEFEGDLFYIEQGGSFADGGALGEELMGGQSSSSLKPSGYRLISSKGREIIVSDDDGKTKERWVKNNGFSGYKIVYKGNDYEFTDSFADGGTIIGTPETPLARGLGISYTGLVGETGAMSSGEMFEDGGKVKFVTDFSIEDGIQVSKEKTEDGKIFYTAFVTSYPFRKIVPMNEDKDYVVKRAKKIYSNMLEYKKNEKFEQGGSLVDGYLTDPNFGDFQAGVYADGGGVDKNFEIELFWKGLSGNERKIGKYVVAEKTLDNLEEQWGHILSIDVIDETNREPISWYDIKRELFSIGREKNLFEQGGSLVDGYLTDPNFGDFQAGVYADGGSTGLPAGTEQSYVNYYLGEGTAQGIYANGGSTGLPAGTEQSYVNYYLGEGSAQGVYAQGGSLGNHGLKEGDQVLKTMSGGIQKVKTKSGDIVYVNLANGYRDAEPPLPFDDGGMFQEKMKWQDAEVGDSARVKEIDRMGLIVKAYGRKFHLRFPNGTEKTFDANELEFIEDNDDFKDGGKTRERRFVNYGQDYEVRYSKDKPKRRGYGYADGGTIDAFQMRTVRGIDNMPTEILTDEQKVQFAKGGSIKNEDIKVGEEFWLSNGDVIEIVRLFKENIDEDWVEYKRNGEKKENSVKELRLFINRLSGKKQKSFRERRNEYLEKLAQKEGDVWDKIGANSGADIRNSDKLLKAYAEGVEEMLQKEEVGKGSFDQEDYDFYTDENWHLFNEFLVWNSYYEPEMTKNEKAWREKMYEEDMREKGKSNYVANPKIISLSDGSKSKSTNYIPKGKIATITIVKDGKEMVFLPSQVLNGVNLYKGGGKIKNDYVYIAKRYVKEVHYDDGKDLKVVKPSNGYWVKKSALKSFNKKFEDGGKTTFKEKATAIAKNFEGKKVKPKYQKEYGKTYDKAEAKEVGNKIAGSQKAKYDSKMSGGGKTKRGGAMQLAKQIRKDGESWQSALKRANEQVRNK